MTSVCLLVKETEHLNKRRAVGRLCGPAHLHHCKYVSGALGWLLQRLFCACESTLALVQSCIINANTTLEHLP